MTSEYTIEHESFGPLRDISRLTVLFTFITAKTCSLKIQRGAAGLAQHEDKNLFLSELSFFKRK